jgi:hypothetical protein
MLPSGGEEMSFDDRTMRLDDSPRDRVRQVHPKCVCTAVYWNGRREGFVVSLNGKTIASATQAYQAWLLAEAKLL